MDKKQVGIVIALMFICCLLTALFMYGWTLNTVNLHGTVGIDMETTSVHCRIKIWQGDNLILNQWHSGVVTKLGDNMTLFWIFGDTDMQVNNIPYLDNGTFITIGNQGTLTEDSVVLPGEWNRTAGTVEDETQSQLNITCTFYPDDAGPYTADCIGLNTNVTASANNLIMYDTFSEVTGIDETFTINVEFQISVSHS